MVFYVPGTQEKDLSKVIMSLQQIGSGLDDTNATIAGMRQIITGPRTYYVRTGGSDSNTGLINSDGGAFLTVQKAVDTATALDSSIYDVTISCAAGTYSNGAGLTAKKMGGAGRIILLGDETTPSNVVFDHAPAGAIGISSSYNPTIYELRGIKWTASGGGATLCWQAQGCIIRHQNCEIGSGWLQQIRSIDSGTIEATGGTLIISGSPLSTGSCIVTVAGMVRFAPTASTISIPNALSISGTGSSFVSSTTTGNVIATAGVLTISGAGVAATTGQRYDVETNSVIRTDGGGANFFPGSIAGATTDGSGIYT